MLRQLFIACLLAASASAQGPNLGLFTNAADVGGPVNKGAASFDPATGEYRITGSGANMWAKQDQFQYVWKEMTGNFTVTATVRFLGQGAAHRKAGIVVRQSLDTDATYADVVVHGDGMPSLQWRPRKAEDTFTFNLPFESPGTHTIKLQRQGARIYMSVGKNGAEVRDIGHTEVTFQPQAPLLVGLAVCSHDANASDTAIFSNVSIVQAAPAAPKK
jgi:TolB protein